MELIISKLKWTTDQMMSAWMDVSTSRIKMKMTFTASVLLRTRSQLFSSAKYFCTNLKDCNAPYVVIRIMTEKLLVVTEKSQSYYKK